VRATDLVWTPGLARWTAAEMLPQLMGAAGVGVARPTAAPSIEYAGFWRRFLAYLIDSMVLGVLCAIAVLLVEGIMGGFHSSLTPEQLVKQPTFLTEWSAGLAMLLVNWLYYAMMESSSHQGTLGKLAIGIYVTNDEGSAVSFFAASVRFWSKFVSGFIVGIGFLMAGFTERKQALHDRVAGTLVLRKR
jgi:uncharacterized RDD family membrane protein YckC